MCEQPCLSHRKRARLCTNPHREAASSEPGLDGRTVLVLHIRAGFGRSIAGMTKYRHQLFVTSRSKSRRVDDERLSSIRHAMLVAQEPLVCRAVRCMPSNSIAGIGRSEGMTRTRNLHHRCRNSTKRSRSASFLCKRVPRYCSRRMQTVQVRVQHRRSCYHRRRRDHASRHVGTYLASAIVRVAGTVSGVIVGGFHDNH